MLARALLVGYATHESTKPYRVSRLMTNSWQRCWRRAGHPPLSMPLHQGAHSLGEGRGRIGFCDKPHSGRQLSGARPDAPSTDQDADFGCALVHDLGETK